MPLTETIPMDEAYLEDTQARPRLQRSITSTTKLPVEPLKNTVLKSHGRPPWYAYSHCMRMHCVFITWYRYDEHGQHLSDAFVIGIAGVCDSGPK